ncbi:HAD family hydrolase [Streptomyces sp. NPDC046985]|uniref:HAD family hydrolase n=1 Tax=Streptomyces sp. NPDC046985 TaxID=3155377 RepID=UPI0033D09BDC
MAVSAVLWDVDDTLFDYTAADRAGMREHLLAERLLDGYASAEEALTCWRRITDAQWARFAAGQASFEGQRLDRVRVFLGRPDLTDAEARAWFDRYLGHYEAAWALFPDVLPVLDALAPRYRRAVLSNSSLHVQERKLRVLGVRDRFEAVLCAAELGVSKPSPGAFHAACDALELAPHEVAYVGDHPEIDGRGAAEAGLLSVWIDRAGGPGVGGLDADGLGVGGLDGSGLGAGGGSGAARRIASLAELPAVLGADSRFGAPSTFG